MKKKEEVEIIGLGDILVGNPSAPVTVMEFVDYESEACEKALPIVKELMKEFGDKINFNFRNFPQTLVHQRAHKAAEAAVGAAQEGKLFEMYEILLKNRRHLGTVSLKNYAREAGVKSKSFLTDLINGIYGWHVQDDLKFGIDSGVTEAPTFFINGEKFVHRLTTKNLSEAIKAALKKRKLKKAA
ncbi:MAG: DsbA family protein [Chitinophagaceae bacterium]|nr:DsbA family protein [Chitinophagaceae bacterium]